MAGNRSRFSKYKMTGSPVFSVNFTNPKNPAKPNYHMSIKKSQFNVLNVLNVFKGVLTCF